MTEQKEEAAVKKLLAEASAAEADVVRIQAEARKIGMEADTASAQYRLTKLEAERREREASDILAADRYHRSYTFDDPVFDATVDLCKEQLLRWHRNDPGCDIEIIVNSPGGDVFRGLSLFNFINGLKPGADGKARRKDGLPGHKITTGCDGMAASMGAVLFQAGDHRWMAAPSSYMLLHEISSGSDGEKTSSLADRVKFLNRVQDDMLENFVVNIQKAKEQGTAKKPFTKEQLKKAWDRKDYTMSAIECLDYGICDELR